MNAVALLAQANYERAGETLLSLVDAGPTSELAIAAVQGLGDFLNRDIAKFLLAPDRWRSYTPATREAVLSMLLSRPQHLSGLLEAIESGDLPAGTLDSTRRNQLMKHKDDAIRARAERLFKQMGTGDRMKIYEEFKSVLTLKSVSSNGREVFKRLCANCHRFEREGIAVGPDLFDIRNQPKESILLHIIVPEYEILPNFAGAELDTLHNEGDFGAP